jgi:FkbM family methyltransferase
MSFKLWINSLISVSGYQFAHRPSVQHDIRSGKYRWLQERGIATVLDIGANTGQFASIIRQVLPDAMIYSFEPLEECYRELKAKAATMMPMECFPFALGNSEAMVRMHKNTFSASSSILEMHPRHAKAFPFTAHSVEVTVQVRTLDSLVPGLVLRPKVLAKIDVQGYEMNVLAGAENALGMFDVLIVETSYETLYDRQPLFDEVYQFLRGHGFAFTGNLEQVADPATGAVLQADAIFVRK